MQKVLLIVNPVAGKTQGKNALFPLTQALCKAGYLPTTYITGGRGDATHVTRSMAAEHDMVICCGGDGTLNEVINGMLDTNASVPLGYIPAGSTNDFANSLRLKSKPLLALQDILTGDVDEVDVGLFNGHRRFSYIASFGMFTAASYNAPQETKNALGHLAYLLEGTKELFATAPTYTVEAEANGIVYKGQYLFGAVCNSTSVAGLVQLNPELVNMSDGLFEVVMVRRPTNVAELGRILTSINTGDFDPELFDFFKASEVTFRMDTPLPWSLDGECADGAQTVVVQNLPKAVKLLHKK